jgi:UDP-N-acetylenolpyruvoylglucosamine reductase
MNDAFALLSKRFPGRIRLNELLAGYTTFKIGGPADLFFEAVSRQDLVDIVLLARKHSIPIFVLGGGTNILIRDKGIRGLVVKNSTRHIVTRAAQGSIQKGLISRRVFVEAESGAIFNTLVRYTIDEGLSGLEMHLGLPGTVGGAMYMNSKWTRPQAFVGDVVYQAEILTQRGEVKVTPQRYFHFGYDSSTIQKTKDIVLTVTFNLLKTNDDRLWNVANESIRYRRATQPQGVSSAGCTFKNVPQSTVTSLGLPKDATSAGYLIDHAGMKGKIIGDAEVSQVHANFIVNKGHARASDVIELIGTTKEKVKKQFGVTLEEEIILVGEP